MLSTAIKILSRTIRALRRVDESEGSTLTPLIMWPRVSHSLSPIRRAPRTRIANAGEIALTKDGGPAPSSCTEIKKKMPGMMDFIAAQRATKTVTKFKCLGAWKTEGPGARGACVKYQIGKGAPRVCKVCVLSIQLDSPFISAFYC